MTINQDALGDLASLAIALGLINSQGQVDTGFFTDPTGRVAGVLRDADRLQALVGFLDQALGASAPPIADAAATWTPLVQLSETVSLYLTTSATGSGTVIGLGARAATSSSPGAAGRLSVPLLLVPPDDAAIVFLPGSSAPEAVATLTAEADLGSAALDSAGLSLSIPLGAGQPPDIGITVTGLLLPGSTSPIDLEFSGLAGRPRRGRARAGDHGTDPVAAEQPDSAR